MRNFELQKDEEVLKVFNDCLVMANENKNTLTVFITTKRLVLLRDVSKELISNTFLRARGTSIPSEDEVVLEIDLDEILDITYENNLNKITFKNSGNILQIRSEEISAYLKKA